MKAKIRLLIITSLTACAMLLAMPETAHAQIYVVNVGNDAPTFPDTVGEYNLDGSTVNSSVISGIDGLHGPYVMAVSGEISFLRTITPARLPNTPPGARWSMLRSISGLKQPWGIAVAGGSIFVANTGSDTVGKYNLDGSIVNTSLFSDGGGGGVTGAYDIVVSGGDIFLANGATISEYTTSGGLVNASLISGFRSQTGIAVSGSDIFVVNDNKVSEYTTSGGLVNASLISGLSGALSIAVSGGDLYVENGDDISEYTTSGALVNASLVSGLDTGLFGIEIASAPEPSTPALAALGGLSLMLLRRRRK